MSKWGVGQRGLAVALSVGASIVGLAAGQQRPRPTAPPAVDEFVGPFPSWLNVKTAFGAVGDGKADDTAAIQRGLSGVGTAGASPVLYLPEGTYRLTSTLSFSSRLNVRVIGADPASVSFVWDGPAGGTMLAVNGLAYSEISRITFNGKATAGVAIEQSLGKDGSNFDTGNQYADDQFVDVGFGIHGGFKDAGFAETSIVRARFVRNTSAGVALGNFNALDIWIWDSLFDHCRVGVTNQPGAGNYRVYDSVFRASAVADLYMHNTGLFSARGNFSSGSKAFYVSERPFNHPANIDIQGNVVIDPLADSAIDLGNQGPGLILDNVIRSRAGARGPVVRWHSLIDADVASIGNTFTVADAVSVKGRLVTFDDRVVPASSITTAEPVLPAPWPRADGPVFEVAAGADGSAIQKAIDAAMTRTGHRPIVHIPFGPHAVTTGLVVPAGDVQIVGDGYGTTLQWSGPGPGPVITLAGATKATLRDLTVFGTAAVDGIVADGLNQAGSRVRMDGVQLQSGQSNLVIDGLDRTSVQIVDFGHAYSPDGVSVRVIGKPASSAAGPLTGSVTMYSGAASGNGLSYDISGRTRVLLRDTWYEGDMKEGFASVHDGASFTMQSVRVATPANRPAPAIAIANPNGRVTILTAQIEDRIGVTGTGASELFSLGVFRAFQRTPYFVNSSQASRVLLLNTRQHLEVQGPFSAGSADVADIGTPDPAFMRQMLAETRAARPPSLSPLPPGVSDLRMFRVWVNNSRNNIKLGAGTR